MESPKQRPDGDGALGSLDELPLDERVKGIPGGTAPFAPDEAADRHWNVLREDLPLPLAVLKRSAVEHNSRWMQRFLALSGAVLAPHGKTTMSPQLFRRQLDDGAWGITLGTIGQVQVARRYGIGRILLANQLVGRQAVRYILDELRRDPDFDFYCLVDSLDGVRLLAEAARAEPAGRPLKVLLEGGVEGRRTGCRSLEAALEVARAVKAAEPHLALSGVEGFEGLISGPDAAGRERAVAAFIGFLVEIARACEAEELFAEGPVILSAGGSAYYDIVARGLAAAGLDRPVTVVLRSGCYLSHDSVMYQAAFERLLERAPEARELGAGLRPALEVWAYAQSRPEPGRVILTLGKRDCSFDAGLPRPLAWFRPGTHDAPQELPGENAVVELNDQHAFMDVPANSPLRVGDMVAFGISHPCLTFDRWQAIPLVDDAYNVVSMIRTFF